MALRSFLWLGAAALAAVSAAPAQGQVLRGRVLDDSTNLPIPTASVTALRSDGQIGGSAFTNDDGRFVIRVNRADWVRVHVSRLGYKDVTTAQVDLTLADTLLVQIRLSVRAVLLAPIEVLARPLSPYIAQFRERMDHYKKLGLGTFIEREEIETFSSMPIPQFISASTAGIRLTEDGRNVLMRATMQLGSGTCSPQWYLNGMPLRFDPGESVESIVRMYDLEAIEIYKGASSLPPEYAGSTGSCGAVGLWTRRH